MRFQKKSWYAAKSKQYNAMGSMYAWWNLSKDKKAALLLARTKGMFGGGPGAPYFWVQEGSTDSGAGGARAAGIKPTFFVKNALDATQETVASMIERALASL
jgi:hypothetical protein